MEGRSKIRVVGDGRTSVWARVEMLNEKDDKRRQESVPDYGR